MIEHIPLLHVPTAHTPDPYIDAVRLTAWAQSGKVLLATALEVRFEARQSVHITALRGSVALVREQGHTHPLPLETHQLHLAAGDAAVFTCAFPGLVRIP